VATHTLTAVSRSFVCNLQVVSLGLEAALVHTSSGVVPILQLFRAWRFFRISHAFLDVSQFDAEEENHLKVLETHVTGTDNGSDAAAEEEQSITMVAAFD
jgi:hypothetical protein